MKLTYFTLFVLSFQYVFAQNNTETYYMQFDTIVNSYASDLNTGQRFEDVYITNSANEFRFFMTDESIEGKITYNTQPFYQCFLKYDLMDDNLLFRDIRSSNLYDVILDPLLVDSFSFQGIFFMKLPVKASNFSFYKNGFFEIITENRDYNLFVKHEKFKNKQLGKKSIYYTYSKKERILLEYKSNFYEISSRNDIVKILPDRKEDIKLFYKNYQNLESQNKIEFMKRLFASLSVTN